MRQAVPLLLTALALLACEGARNARGFQVDEPEPAGPLEVVQQPARVCADGPTVDGIDVSTYQGDIDWDRVAGSNIRYAIVRIGDGLGEDDHFERNWNGARRVGLIRGSYQFFRTLRDPEEMAALVVRKVGRLGPGDLPVVLDLEGASIQDQPANVVRDHARRWLRAVEEGTGKRPIIYTGYYVWRDQVGNPDFSEYPLWIAAYVNHCPDIPDAWNRWTFWQTSSSGRVPGIAGNVDTDLFNGTLEDLQRLADGGGTAYGARFVAQSFPYAAEPPVELTVGESVEGWFDMRNTGTETWGENTRFAPTPRDQTGPFGPEGWLNETRISACGQATPPGETCRFNVRLTGHEPGETIQYFGMVEEGRAWFSDPEQGGPPDDQLAVRLLVHPAPVLPDMAAPPPPDAAPVTPDAAPVAPDAAPTTPDAGPGPTPPDGPDADPLAPRPDAGFADVPLSAADAFVEDAGPTAPGGALGANLEGGCQSGRGPAALAPFALVVPLLARRRRRRRR